MVVWICQGVAARKMLQPNCYFDLSAVLSCACDSPDVTLMLGQYSTYIKFFSDFHIFSHGKSLVTISMND